MLHMHTNFEYDSSEKNVDLSRIHYLGTMRQLLNNERDHRSITRRAAYVKIYIQQTNTHSYANHMMCCDNMRTHPKEEETKNLLCMQAHRYTDIALAVAFFCLFCLSSYVLWFCSVMVHCFANTATISHRNWFYAQNMIYFFFVLALHWKFPLDAIETP